MHAHVDVLRACAKLRRKCLPEVGDHGADDLLTRGMSGDVIGIRKQVSLEAGHVETLGTDEVLVVCQP